MLTNKNFLIIPITFTCTIINNKILKPNFYNIKLNVEPNVVQNEDISIGYERIQYFTDNCLQDSIIINQNHQFITSLEYFDNKLIILPCEPYDFYIGSILFQKLKLILEDYFELYQITIDSAFGDHIQCCITNIEDCGLDLLNDNWWNKNDISTGQTPSPSWNDLNLGKPTKFTPKIIKGGLSDHR